MVLLEDGGVWCDKVEQFWAKKSNSMEENYKLDKLDQALTSKSSSKKGSDTPPIVMPSPKKGSNNTYSEYFDNLLSLIDKASKDLSL